MNLPVVVTPEAKADIAIDRRHFNAERTGLGHRFSKEVQRVLARIEEHPRLFPIVWRDVRAVRLNPFKHVLYYVILPDRIEVIGVIHGSRDSSAWKSRR